LRLTELPIGSVARISSIDDSPHKEKLQEMGCIPGVLVKPIMRAPLGDPIAFELEEYTLSMRKNEAFSIQVNLLNPLFNI
jgi:ferrous iron transport protein A|tara:strand:+ start:9653 stop:9892 length:240 start_codon:yes stop_codon:yes gene_type:complete